MWVSRSGVAGFLRTAVHLLYYSFAFYKAFLCQILWQSVKAVVEIWQWPFSRWQPSAILDFYKVQILLADRVLRVSVHHHAKFQPVAKIWRFFDVQNSCNLPFWTIKNAKWLLMFYGMLRVQVCHRAQFFCSHSNHHSFFIDFYPCSAILARVLAVIVCLSVCLSHAGIVSKRLRVSIMQTMLCDSPRTLVSWCQESLVGDPLSPEICAQSDLLPFRKPRFRPISAHGASTMKTGEKSSISTYRNSTAPLLLSLHCLPVQHRITYKTAVLTHNVLTTLAPSYLSDMLHTAAPAKQLRSSATPLLIVPRTRIDIAGRSFSVAALSCLELSATWHQTLWHHHRYL